MRVAFHLNGILALYVASTSTRSATLGWDPFTQLKQQYPCSDTEIGIVSVNIYLVLGNIYQLWSVYPLG